MSLTIIKIEKLLVGLIKERKKFEYNLGKKTQIDKLFFFDDENKVHIGPDKKN